MVLALALFSAFATFARPASAGSVAKGITDPLLWSSTPERQANLIREIGPRLHARWVRIQFAWSDLEPQQGAYSDAEVERLDGVVDALAAAKIKVILSVSGMPSWAGDRSWWGVQPPGQSDGPQSYTPIASSHLEDFARLGEWIASHFRGRVSAIECWNEPNLWSYIYPQRTAADPYFAPRVYLSMLKAFHAGVRRAGTGVQIVAGATAPVGLNDRLRTSPQRFARFLSRHHAGRWFDVYSHHPYTPGGSVFAAPDRPPNDMTTTVTLYNLRTLLHLFPRKPFYLTEYGYSTQYSIVAARWVSPRQQAAYLKLAYSYVRRYRQVKLLVWFLLYDIAPSSGQPSDMGVYSGLRTAGGKRKPAWYAFRALPR